MITVVTDLSTAEVLRDAIAGTRRPILLETLDAAIEDAESGDICNDVFINCHGLDGGFVTSALETLGLRNFLVVT